MRFKKESRNSNFLHKKESRLLTQKNRILRRKERNMEGMTDLEVK